MGKATECSLGGVLLLALAGCTVWQGGNVVPAYVNGNVHRGSEALEFDAQSATLASGGWDGKVALWRVGGAEPERVWEAHEGFVQGVGFHDRIIVTGGQDGALRTWTRTGEPLASAQSDSPVARMRVLGERVASGHYDGSVRVWSLPQLVEEARFELHGGEVAALAVHGPSGRIASGGYDGKVFLLETGRAPRPLAAPPLFARSLAFSSDGDTLYGGGWIRVFRWDLAGLGGGERIEVMRTPHWGLIADLQYVAGDHALASISRINDSSVFFLDADTGQALRHFKRQSICGTAIRVSPDGRYLAATGDDGIIRMWDLLEAEAP